MFYNTVVLFSGYKNPIIWVLCLLLLKTKFVKTSALHGTTLFLSQITFIKRKLGNYNFIKYYQLQELNFPKLRTLLELRVRFKYLMCT